MVGRCEAADRADETMEALSEEALAEFVELDAAELELELTLAQERSKSGVVVKLEPTIPKLGLGVVG